jgi:mono/diheme cytochrome c family protein
MKQVVLFAVTMMVSMGACADVQRGKQLHDEQCIKCHDDSVYTRKEHFVTSKKALVTQVNRCAMNAGAQWSEEDIADVVDYLNTSYYKFE